MGWTRAALNVVRDVLSPPNRVVLEMPAQHVFDTAPRPVDQVIAAMKYGDMVNVSRDAALSVAAVQRARNEICSIATLPLALFKGLDKVDSPLFRQFDPDVPNVVHMSMTLEDLMLEKIAWWQITGQDFDRYPASVRRIDPCKVSLVKPGKSPNTTMPGLPPLSNPDPTYSDDSRYVWIDHGDGKGWQQFPAALMIRFDSPNPGVLRANARAIRIAIKLDRLTEMYAENPALREFFTDNTEADVDLMSDDEIDGFLAEYGAMRAARPYGWIPSNVKRTEAGTVSPRDLTLADLQQQVTLAIANGTGVDPEDLGINTTSRVYQNSVDRKQDKINRVYAPYMSAITDRLSMGDVTKRGYAPRFDLVDYLKSDPVTQATYWKALQDMGVVDEAWIGEQAGIPSAVVTRSAAAAPATAPALPAGQNSGRPPIRLGDITPARTFDNPGTITFDVSEFAGTQAPPTADVAARTITGLAVPYNQVATKFGVKYRFKPGSLEYSSPDRMPVLKNHADPVGMHKSIKDTADGPIVELAIADGIDGSPEKITRDQLLHDAAGGMYTGLSVGVDFSMYPEDGDVEFNEADQVYDVARATWRETSSTHLPAFDNARVTKVAADLTGGNNVDPCQHCGHRHAPNVACQTFIAQLRTQPTNPAPAPHPAPAPAPAPTSPGAAATFEQFQAWVAANQEGATPTEGPTLVNPHAGPAQVREPAPYRFDRTGNLRAGTHDFSSDLIAGWRPGGGVDQAARDRAEGFLRDQYAEPDDNNPAARFAITPANVVNLNYPQNRPDAYVDQMEFEYPIWNAINKGTLDAVTPFVIPKFNSSSGLVADHVTGTEPTPGTFTATAQTITPSAVSGKVEITREAFDQGGNPQMSGLIYRQMTRGYFEALESYAVAQLVAVAASMTDLTITTAAADSALDQAIATALIPLKYIRGGDRFRNVYTQIDLYTAMVKAKDSNGRRLYPSIGAQNAVGTADPRYDALDAHGKLWLPAWATAATSVNAASSYMFDPEKVCGWASAPQRIDITWRVAWVDLGIWGYKAFGVTDFAGTREIVYDPV